MNTPKKILILSSNPKATPPLRIDEEVHKIEEVLKRSKNRDQFTLRTMGNVRFINMLRALLEYELNIVHFTGHGNKEGLILEDELGLGIPISYDVIANLFGLFKGHMECVFLNVAYSAEQAKAINQYIPYVIGMNNVITNKASIDFAEGFYSALGNVKSIEKAFRFGQVALQKSSNAELSVPVLLQNPKNFTQYRQTTKIERIPPPQVILIVLASPKDKSKLRFDEEVREIKEGLRRSKYRKQFTIRSRWIISIRNLRRAILEYKPEIIHFIGHRNEHGLMVEDVNGSTLVATPKALSGLFEQLSTVSCVILNGCYSETQASAISKHINYVIGTNGSIEEKIVIDFS